MITDGRTVESSATLHTEICIVGAGPAGLTVASELLDWPGRVLIVESGGLRTDPSADTLSQLQLVSSDFDSPNETRRRQFGGMASSWDTPLPDHRLGAKYLPLDEIDFEQRDWVPFSGWPFRRDELLPFYKRARATCGLGTAEPSLEDLAGDGLVALAFTGDTITTSINQLGPAEAFTASLRAAIERSRNVTALLHATVTALETEGNGALAGVARIRCLHGPAFSIRARIFILAMGAIENARLLLLSDQGGSTGLGNGYGNVGRYYMDHHYVLSGVMVPRDTRIFEQTRLYDVRSRQGAFILGKLTVSDAVMRRECLLNSSVLLQPLLAEEHAAIVSLKRRVTTGVPDRRPAHAHNHTLTVLAAMAQLVSTGFQLAWWQRRLRPSLRYGQWSYLGGNRRRFGSFALVHQLEQAPHPENRVVLGHGKDELGSPIPRLQWHWSELDLHSLERSQQLFVAAFERSGIGVMDIGSGALAAEFARRGLAAPPAEGDRRSPWLLTRRGAHHHLGTTRMHRDPKRGVVDEHCRVHGVSNVFVAGGSVFPTGGYANPTLTIVALAMRLADHVKALVSG